MLGSTLRGLVVVVFALLALVAPPTGVSSSPLEPRDNGTECTRQGFPLWHLISDADARGVGNLKSHVAWGKKSGKCYPKGIESAADGDKDTHHTLLIADMYVDPEANDSGPSYTTGNVTFATKRCTTLRLPSDSPNDTCQGLIKLNSQFQFAVDTIGPKKEKSCELCTWDRAKGNILGYQVAIYSPDRK
ncbi:hypothetical protein HDU86_004537 [Geranomyces michiganensis]|nr:hypothetical protein HDU86_004537 [Geranomyces michiganensis]